MEGSIEAAIKEFHENFSKACAGSDITGNVTGTLSRFLATAELPPYYQMKAHLALSSANEQNEPHENMIACRHHLKAAENALAESRTVYKDAEDVQTLRIFEEIINDEWNELRERNSDAESD